MKIINFNEYLSNEQKVYEYRTPGALNKNKKTGLSDVNKSDKVVMDGEIVNTNNVDMNDFIGVKANENPSHGLFDIDIPTEEDAVKFDDKKVWNENIENLWDVISTQTNFFIQGEAGWAKTDLITQMALKCGFHVITVYLDKAVAEDLAGLPVTKEYRKPNGEMTVRQQIAMPLWAQFMLDNPDKKFLLFFDELNQATNDVMNALMPICHPHKRTICNTRFDNYFVGAAGNMDSENELQSIPIPLMARLGGRPITWITGLDKDPQKAMASWQDAFDYLHSVWDNKIGKNIVDMFNENCMIFASPRDIELNIFESLYNYKKMNANNKNYYRISERRIIDKIKNQTYTVEGVQNGQTDGYRYSSTIDKKVRELANACYEWLMKNDETKTRSFDDTTSSENEDGDENMTNKNIEKYIKLALNGVFYTKDKSGKQISIPITPETLKDLFEVSAENMNLIKNTMKKKGYIWRFPTLDDALSTGNWTKEDIEL